MTSRIRLATIIATLFSLTIPSMVFAASTTGTVVPPNAQGLPGEGLQIQPPLITTTADPGQTLALEIKIRNISGGVLVISSVADDFGAKGEDGEPSILPDNSATTRYSLKQWISPIGNFRQNPQQIQTIPVKVSVPANAEPGGHYAIIRFSGAAPSLSGANDGTSSSGSLGLNASIGALVLFTVNGNIKQHVSTVDVAAKDAKGQSHGFFEMGPITFVERLKNDGNVHEAVTGSIVIKNLFGKTTAKLNFNGKKGNILPDAIRKFSQTLDKKYLFGRYTINGDLKYGGSNAVVMPVASFWVIPYRLLLVVLIGVLIIFFLLRFGLKRYNERIIAQARRR